MKKNVNKQFSAFKTTSRKNLSPQFEKKLTKKRYCKINANEIGNEDVCELSSVKKLFWVNQATKKARNFH